MAFVRSIISKLFGNILILIIIIARKIKFLMHYTKNKTKKEFLKEKLFTALVLKNQYLFVKPGHFFLILTTLKQILILTFVF